MSDYTSQFAGAEIDARLAKVQQLETGLAGKQAQLVSGQNIKTINDQSILGPGNITIEGGGEDGTGIEDINSSQDGTVVITLSNGDRVTIDMNHNHPAYPKYTLLDTESDYNSIQNKESDRLYLIKEQQSS